jgi:hypothetical protein
MPKIATSPMTQSIRTASSSFNSSSGIIQSNPGLSPNNTILLVSGSVEGSIVKSILFSSTNANDILLKLYISNDGGTTKYLVTSIIINAFSGSASSNVTINDILSLSSMTPFVYDNCGKPVLYLPSGTSLYVGITSAPASGRFIFLNTILEDF